MLVQFGVQVLQFINCLGSDEASTLCVCCSISDGPGPGPGGEAQAQAVAAMALYAQAQQRAPSAVQAAHDRSSK